ncbi:MAG: SDR family oxidoreductase [Synechococcaceae cyanobacterium SM2_3_2]|nr:SDR family oxidoreductase [Synechococcaceae cyanobacterium SM2_3_2]
MKTALVTGASRGLGLEYVRQLAAKGYRVFAASRQPVEALSTLALDHPDQVEWLQLDVNDAASIQAAVAVVAAKTPQLDLLINGAGLGEWITFGSSEKESFMAVLETNTVAPLMVTQAFYPLLKAAGSSIVANMSSLLGSIGHKAELVKGGYAYSASKAALNLLTRYMSIELAEDGIIFAALSPGWVKTDMGGPEAPLTPTESIAGLIAVMEKLTPAMTGRFWHYDGSELPW